jgi:hypothetical protein
MHYTREEIIYSEAYLVIITLHDEPRLGSGTFEELLQLWLRYYELETEFLFLFETRFLAKLPPLSYCFKMALFIYNLKKQPRQFLKQSTILVDKKGIMRMLDFIFWVQSPVAPVLIYRAPEQILSHHDLATSDFQHLVLDTNMKLLKP